MLNSPFATLPANTGAGRIENLVSATNALFQMGLMAWRQRCNLADLDDARLADLGISRADADAEARRPIWDIPRSWMQK